jgi:hypothetical protein
MENTKWKTVVNRTYVWWWNAWADNIFYCQTLSLKGHRWPLCRHQWRQLNVTMPPPFVPRSAKKFLVLFQFPMFSHKNTWWYLRNISMNTLHLSKTLHSINYQY